MKRYVLHPGEVISKTDGDIHYISALKLAALYGVDYRLCYVKEDSKPISLDRHNWDEYMHLYPRYKGDYKEHIEKLRADYFERQLENGN